MTVRSRRERWKEWKRQKAKRAQLESENRNILGPFGGVYQRWTDLDRGVPPGPIKRIK